MFKRKVAAAVAAMVAVGANSAMAVELQDGQTIMPGTVPAVTLNGAQVPSQSTGHDRPVMVMLKGEIHGPNGYAVSLDGCEAIFEPRAEISTGRVHFEGKSLSCHSGGAALVSESFYAVAADASGRAGLKANISKVNADAVNASMEEADKIVSMTRELAENEPNASNKYRYEKAVEYRQRVSAESGDYLEINGGIPIDVLLVQPVKLTTKADSKPAVASVK